MLAHFSLSNRQRNDRKADFNRPLTRFITVLNSGGSAAAAVRVDGRLYNTPVSFTWEPGTTHDVDIASLFPVVSDRSLRVFQSWNDGADRVRQVIAGDQAVTYTATYGIQYALSPETVGSGRVVLAPASLTLYFDQGTTVQLNATPTLGNQFVGWGNDLGGSQNPKTVVIRESIDPIAFFGSLTAVSNFGIMNSARQQPNTQITGNLISARISPGEIVTVNMEGVGPDTQSDAVPDADGAIPTRLAETRVLVNNVPVPVISAVKGHVTAFIPYGASALLRKFTSVQIEYRGGATGAGIVSMVEANPAIYTADGSGSGQGKVNNEAGNLNDSKNPARKGSLITFFACGLGLTYPVASDNMVSANMGAPPKGELEVRIGGAVAEVVSAGIAPGQLGVYRIQARVPDSARPGSQTPLILTLDGAPSQFDVTMAVQ